jgi:N-methylhydantoinase A
MLVADVRTDVSRTVLRAAAANGGADLDHEFTALEQRALAAMREEGVPPESIVLTRRIDARYAGQSFELTVPAAGWTDAFHKEHLGRYGWNDTAAAVQAVSLRVEAAAPSPAGDGTTFEPPRDRPVATQRIVPVRHEGVLVQATLMDRDTLARGLALPGPAILTEYSATTWVPPGWTALVLGDGSLNLSMP